MINKIKCWCVFHLKPIYAQFTPDIQDKMLYDSKLKNDRNNREQHNILE